METWLLPKGTWLLPKITHLGCSFKKIAPRENMVILQEEHSCSEREHVYMLGLDVLPWGATMFPRGTIMFETLCEHNFCM
jgi:hypothetical protein